MRTLVLLICLLSSNLFLQATPDNDECVDAIVLPISPNDPICGSNNIKRGTTLNATASIHLTVDQTNMAACAQGNEQDIWFKVTVPINAQNIIIRKRANTTINATIEAYKALPNQQLCDKVEPLGCSDLNEAPNALILENVQGLEILLRVWGTTDQNVGGDIVLSAHILPDNLTSEWIICDDITGEGSGRFANQLIVTYQPGVQPDGTLFPDLSGPFKRCDCGPQVIELWQFDNEIELEVRKKAAAQQMAEVEETDYNFNIDDKNVVAPITIGTIPSPPSTISYTSNAPIVKVGVVDSGIDENHEWFNGVTWLNTESDDANNCVLGDQGEVGYNFRDADLSDFTDPMNIPAFPPTDIDGHGSWVASVLTAEDGFGDVQPEIISAQFHRNNQGSLFDAVCGMYYTVAEGANILNLSWGFTTDTYPEILKDALNYIECQDVLVVCSAGNFAEDNDNFDLAYKLPANATKANIITVAACYDDSGTITFADYSNFGNESVDLAAVGSTNAPIINTQFGSTRRDGTSIAAPQVAECAMIIKGTYPHLTATEIRSCILDNVTTVTAWQNQDLMVTNGYLNHDAAITCAAGISNKRVKLKLKVFLQGAYDDTGITPKMMTTLHENDLIPTNEPFGTGNGETIPSDFDESLEIVDWVKVTLIGEDNRTSPATKIKTEQAVLLTKDGTIVNTEGSSILMFQVTPTIPYDIRIESRNHLSIQTKSPVLLAN